MSEPAATVADFNRLYYDSRVWSGDTLWFGVVAQKLPTDLWTMQEILVETRPEVLVETGVSRGGSTLYYACLFDLLGDGEVVGIDIDLSHVPDWVANHPRVTLIEGGSTDGAVLGRVDELVDGRRTMVTLDSDHSAEHVADELRAYAPLVSEGCYLVVEDTNLNGNPVRPDFGPGPMEALEEWLGEDPPFELDPAREKLLATFNPRGYLRRTGVSSVRGEELPAPAVIGTAEPHRAPAPAAPADPARELYLDVLKRTLTGYTDPSRHRLASRPKARLEGAVFDALRREGLELVTREDVGDEMYEEGRAWPASGVTMVGFRRLDNLRDCIETILADGVRGHLIETGVWRGGASIFMRAVLKVHGVTDRQVWVADSFAGLPPPKPDEYPADRGDRHHEEPNLAVSARAVRENFRRFGLLDEQVRFLKGWFSESLPKVRNKRWALVRLDGDMYESTMDSLTNLYPNLSPGGFLIVDDYLSHKACREAVHDYREANGITEEIQEIDWAGAFWRVEG